MKQVQQGTTILERVAQRLNLSSALLFDVKLAQAAMPQEKKPLRQHSPSVLN